MPKRTAWRATPGLTGDPETTNEILLGVDLAAIPVEVVWAGGKLLRLRRLRKGTAPGSAGKAFTVDPRVVGQLSDARLGPLAGKITPQRLHELVNNNAARRFFDSRTGNINVIQEIEGRLIRITVAGDKFKVISVGPIRERNILNLIENGGFIPLK